MTPAKPTDSTVKVKSITREDEILYAQRMLDEATQTMINNPGPETIEAFLEANRIYFETEWLYKTAWRLLTERARRLVGSVLGLNDF